MIIKRIKIDRYGPLNNIDLIIDTNFQPIFGINESGKTLILDFITKKLLGLHVSKDDILDRVDEFPEGFIVLFDGNEELKLERDVALTNYLPVTHDEIRNIFLIRDSDLKLYEEDKFYERITDRLTGIRSSDIRKIIKKTLEFGRLMPEKKELSNKAIYNKVKGKLGRAKKLRKSVNNYIIESQVNKLNEIEGELYDKRIKLKEKKSFLSKLDAAKTLDNFSSIEGKIGDSKKLISSLSKMISEDEIKSISTKLESKNDDIFIIIHNDKIKKFTRWNILISLLISTIIWLIWIFVNIPTSGLINPIITSSFLICNLFLWIIAHNKLKHFKKNENEIMKEANKLGIKVDSINSLKEKMQNIMKLRKDSENELKENIGVLKNHFNLKSSSHNDIIETSLSRLEKTRQSIDFNVRVKYDEAKYEKAKEDCDKLQDVLKILEKKITEHTIKLREFSIETENLDYKYFLKEDLDLDIENLKSLELLILKLDKYINEIENNESISKEVITIFEEIDEEEKTKITKIFSKKNNTAMIFSEITDGRYINVYYDTKNKEIIVVKSNKEELPARNLSKGTFDQLYLAIRIDFAQRLLKNKNGFFIMDDTFLTASKKRFENGLRILQDLTISGWQIIYLTAKESDFLKICEITGEKGITLEQLD